MAGDLATLVEMGFDPQRAELAVKKTGGLQGALQWLEDNENKSWEELSKPADADADADDNPAIEAKPLQAGEVARSMVCEDCGKKLRSMMQAQAHGERTQVVPFSAWRVSVLSVTDPGTSGHDRFAESAEELAPLTEEEKKQKLEELRQKAAERKSLKAIQDREEAKANEKIRMKATKEVQDAKENLAKQEQIKAAAKKRQEKADDIAAKRRIQEKIAADKEARRLKAEALKAEREGKAPPPDPSLAAAASAQATASSVPKKAVTDARLRLQTAAGVLTKTYPAETTLAEVAQGLEAENGVAGVESFTMTYPKKTFTSIDFGQSLKEAGLAPSAVLIVK